MVGGLRGSGRRLFLFVPDALAALGLVDRARGRETFDLAVPAMVTAGIWSLLRITDFFMVSIALSDAAVAALEFAFQYYFVGFSLAIAVSSGTISLVSRFDGAGDHANAAFAVKQSVWFAIMLSLPLTLVSWFYAEVLIDLLTDNREVIRLGATYLRIVMLALVVRFVTMVAARGLEGCGDTRTPMYVNLFVIPLNFVLNALLIFGLGPFPRLGIAGAAWGTAISNTVGAVIYLAIYASGRFALRLHLGGKQWDTEIAREIVRVGTPLAGMRLLTNLARFPFLFILGVLGTPVVAAFAIGRQIVQLAMIPGWGFQTSSSALVGQSLGRDDEDLATAYGKETVVIGLATQITIAGAFAIAARPIALVFGTEAVDLTVLFVYVFALSVAGSSVAQTLQGGLRGAGDTTWPFYGTIVGTVLRLGISALGLPSAFVIAAGGLSVSPGVGIGIAAVFAGMLADTYARGGINAVRFWSGRWKEVAKRSTVGGAVPRE